MDQNPSFSQRHNAKRAAEKMIAAGTAPAVDYELRPRDDGRFEVVWLNGSPATTEVATVAEPEQDWPEDSWPTGTQVKLTGTIIERIDADCWQMQIDGTGLTIVISGDELPAPRRRSTKPRAERRTSKSAELDAAAARGEMPIKPDVTATANHHYQKRFDRLAELADADDWHAIRGYECNGINSYAKMVRQYRDRLLAAHAAQQS